MPRFFSLFLCLFFSSQLTAAEPIRSHHAAKALEIYRHIVEIDTSRARGNTLPLAGATE